MSVEFVNCTPHAVNISREDGSVLAGVIYIVSLITLNALKGIRSDLVAPGNLIRDEGGNIVGCDGLTVA